MTNTTLTQPLAQEKPAPVHGPELGGVLRWTGIGLWLGIFLLSLLVFWLSLYRIDAQAQVPCLVEAEQNPHLDPEYVQEVCIPFQAAIFQLGLTLPAFAHYFTILRLLAGLPYFLISFLIVRRRSDRLMAVLFAVLLPVLGAAGTWYNPLWLWASDQYSWLELPVQLLGTILLSGVILLYTFPDGRFIPGWTKWLAPLAVLTAIGSSFFAATALDPGSWPRPINLLPNLTLVGSGLLALLYRYRKLASPAQKQQIKWFVAGAALIVLNWLADYTVWEVIPSLAGIYLIQAGMPAVLWELGQDSSWFLAQFLFAACIGISVFRYRLWDIDQVVNRVLVYGALTLSTMGIYLATVSLMGLALQGLSRSWIFFLATGLVAILFEPLRSRLQRGVNRLMYGDRDDPYAVLSRLSNALEATPSPSDVLSVIASTVGQALKIPYVSILLDYGQDTHQVASYGQAREELLSIPLFYQGEPVGLMSLARRSPGEEFSSADRGLIETIVRQAGTAAQAVRLTGELVRSRAQIVAAREEERRRLRRDLHDGLGPILASQSLKVAAARQILQAQPDQAERLLGDVLRQNESTVAEVRRLVYGLRPPALDELGLVEAVRDLVNRSAVDGAETAGLAISVQVPKGGLPALPAAVEANAYRIALEAVTNAARHARAQRCLVQFDLLHGTGASPALRLQVSDDGSGLPEKLRAGVGLRSMRDRAEELGGSLEIVPRPGGGTLVIACLPCLS